MSDTPPSMIETLVVDDSATILATAKKMLADEFVVHTAKNGAEAWELISSNENIKIVFSDMQMPEMNGMQLLLKVRESDDPRIAKLPMIMITGASDSPAGKRAVFDIGATDFIGKPFDAIDLVSRARTNTSQQRRSTDRANDRSGEVFITPSGFQTIGKESMARSLETKESFSLVHVELSNIAKIKDMVGDKVVRQVIVSLVKRMSDELRERDVATRIGENKFAILIYSDHHNTKQAVERLSEHMNRLVFEIKGKTLPIELIYGFTTIDCYDEESDFIAMCGRADDSLAKAAKITLGNRIASVDDGEQLVKQVEVETEVVDVLSSLEHVVDGNYHLIDESEVKELVRLMNAFLEYANDKDYS